VSKVFAVVCCVAFMVMAFWDVGAFVENARGGLFLFGNNVAPVLFPFFFISGLLIELGIGKRGVVPMSLLAGYPTGARMLAQLYGRGEITRTQAIKIATYTSTCSPIFIIATLGSALFGDVRLGVIIFVAHVVGALLNGLLYRKIKFDDTYAGTTKATSVAPDVCDAVSRALYSAVQNILVVGGLILIFFVASSSLPLPLAAIMEMTTGVFRAEPNLAGIWRAIVPVGIVSFGGLCVAMQGFVFLKTFKMPVWFYFVYKVTHTTISVVVAVVICLLLRV